MSNQPLKETLRARFDAGEALRPGLEAELAADPRAEAYCLKLEAVEAQLGGLTLHSPDPRLAAAVIARLQAEETPVFARPVYMAAALAAGVMISLIAGYFLQPWLPYSEMERQAAAFSWQELLQADGVLLAPVPMSALDGVPYAERALGWIDLEPLYSRIYEDVTGLAGQFSFAGAYLWISLLAACLGLALFNGLISRTVQPGGTTAYSGR